MAWFVATLAWGCAADVLDSPRIRALTPHGVPQGAHLTLSGAAFGDYDPARSAVFVEGLCADIGAWTPDRVDVVVPTGVGVGDRVLVLVRADGSRTHTTLSVGGRDLAVRSRTCETLLRGSAAPLGDAADWEAEVPDVVGVPDVPPGPPGWFFVRLDDLSLNGIGRNPGADIDAVVLRKADGRAFAAARVLSYEPSPLVPELADPDEALGWPDAFTYFPDLSWCDIYDGTVSLGGSGVLVLRLEAAVAPGDTLEIYERGGCYYAPELTSLPEAFMVSVGRGDDRTAAQDLEWFAVGEGEGPQVVVPILTLAP